MAGAEEAAALSSGNTSCNITMRMMKKCPTMVENNLIRLVLRGSDDAEVHNILHIYIDMELACSSHPSIQPKKICVRKIMKWKNQSSEFQSVHKSGNVCHKNIRIFQYSNSFRDGCRLFTNRAMESSDELIKIM